MRTKKEICEDTMDCDYLTLEVLVDIRDELEKLNDISLTNIRGDIRGER